MKKFYLFLAFCAIVTSSNASITESILTGSTSKVDSTIILTFAGTSAAVGEEICIPLYGQNFTDIVSFQWEIHFDPFIFSYTHIQKNPLIENLSINEENAADGRVNMLYFDPLLMPISITDEPILEICFYVSGQADIPTNVTILNSEEFPAEIVKANSDEPNYPVVISESIFIDNNLDCGLILYCPQEVEYVFTPGMVIHKRDFIEDYDMFLRCYGYEDKNLKIINMSAPGALPGDSLIMTCENVYHNMSIGVVIQGESFEVMDGDTTFTTASFAHCQSSVIFNIPDNLEDCTNTFRSCIDPLRCKSIEVNVTEETTIIDYESIIDSENFDACDANFYNQFESIAAIPDEWPNGFALSCSDYQDRIELRNIIEATIAPNEIFIGEWCNSVIELTGVSAACIEDSTHLNGDFKVEMSGGVMSVLLNGTPLPEIEENTYYFDSEKIEDENEISVIPFRTNPLFGISTLDVVLIYNLLIKNEYSTTGAIAADLDLSGSPTTSDLIRVRKNILGISNDLPNLNFIVEKGEDFSDFNHLDFENKYQTFQFSKSDVFQSTSPANLEIGCATSNGQNSICVPVKGNDLLDIAAIQSTFQWDPSILTFTGINEVSMSDVQFGSDNIAEGILRWLWIVPLGTESKSYDEETLFELCFDVIGGEGEITEINLIDQSDLMMEITVTNPELASFRPSTKNGHVIIGTGDCDEDISSTSVRDGFFFELFKYGNVSEAVSRYHKSETNTVDNYLILNDQKFESGQKVMVPITVAHNGSDPIQAFDLGLEHKGLELIDISHSYQGDQLMINATENNSKISFFLPKNKKDINIDLVFQAKKSGKLSDHLSFSQDAVNEIVTEKMTVAHPELKFTDELTISNQVYVFPNPAQGQVYLSIPPSYENGIINIYNNLGQQILTKNITSENMSIDLEAINAKGLLHITVFDGEEHSSFKIVAQ